MSISLNNHEARIAALENPPTGSIPKGWVSWNNAEEITVTSSEYIVSKSGWITLRQSSDGNVDIFSLFINGKKIAHVHGIYRVCHDSTSCTIPVNNGDKIKSDGYNWSGYFLPLNL